MLAIMAGKDRLQGGRLGARPALLCALVLAAALLAGCSHGSGRHYGAVPVERPLAAGGKGVVIVTRGDTLSEIAERQGVPLEDLIAANDLHPPFVIHPGQRLRMPRPARHEVQRGETLYAIARRYGTDVKTLARANALAPPYTIVPGQSLALTGQASGQTRLASAGKRVPSPTPRQEAMAPGTPLPRPKPEVAGAGTKPGPGTTAAPSASAPAPSRRPRFAPVPKATGPYMWPVPDGGRVVSTFGPKGNGYQNDGINIAAPLGARVVAAKDGVVVYVGDRLRGFGRIIVLKHPDNSLTVYAHLSSTLVTKGQRVAQGQTIAQVGQSGNVSSPQLHFEVRRGNRALNPGRYFQS